MSKKEYTAADMQRLIQHLDLRSIHYTMLDDDDRTIIEVPFRQFWDDKIEAERGNTYAFDVFWRKLESIAHDIRVLMGYDDDGRWWEEFSDEWHFYFKCIEAESQ